MRLHNYAYAVKADSTADRIVRMVGASRRVLELGSGPGMITRLLAANQCRVTALELDPASVETVSQFCEAVHPCDLNRADWPSVLGGASGFDVIVAGDVLEHLYDPWTTLETMRPLLADGGHLVVSLPHAGHSAVIACLLGDDFDYRPWGLLDRTHIRWFGMKNIQRLFDDAGWKIVEADFVVKAPEDTELAAHWKELPAATREALATSRFGNVYQVVLKAVPRSAPGAEVQLVELPVVPPMRGSFRTFTRALSLSLSRLLTRPRS